MRAILEDYHSRGITSRKKLKDYLYAEHGVVCRYVISTEEVSGYQNLPTCACSETTIGRALSAWGLKAAGATAKDVAPEDVRQLVIDEMAKDPNQRRGPRTIKEGIQLDTGVHLPRYVNMPSNHK